MRMMVALIYVSSFAGLSILIDLGLDYITNFFVPYCCWWNTMGSTKLLLSPALIGIALVMKALA
jgi:hypothetical protein